MAPDFKTYLATEIVSEQKTLSYRNVSRALKVHVNAAKCMLYEFYQRENKKKPDSIYATYLIAGTKKDAHLTTVANGDASETNGNATMPSSPPPFPSSMANSSQRSAKSAEELLQVPVKTITLVTEERFQEVKKQYEKITSLHIYSLSPGKLQDIQVLTDINRGLFTDVFSKEDPLVHNKTYGVIQNPYARRRKGKRPMNIDAPKSKQEAVKIEKSIPSAKPPSGIASKLANSSGKKEETTSTSQPSSRDGTTTTESKSKPPMKKDASSLFKAFAKQSSKPKLERQDTDASAASGSGVEDVKMTDADEDGESEGEALFLDTNTRTGPKKRASDVRQEKDERQAKLRKMMDSDDEAETEVPTVAEATDMQADPPAAKKGTDADVEDEDVAWSDSDTEKKQSKSTKETGPIEAEPRRRRGKRKVMKKRTVEDEDGYLVTREEEAWESFSEDEPEPTRAATSKPKSSFSAAGAGKTQPSQKSTGAAAKGGEQPPAKKKDIMSFFGKK